jgi:DNA-binding transcriptional MocR family regulator
MAVATPTISFARGVPSPDLLPAADIAAAAARALEHDPTGALVYGGADGYPALREWVAERHGVAVDRVFLTNGSLQGMALLAELLFAGSGGRAVVEAPTYDRTLLLLQRFGATVDAIRLESDGMDVDALEAHLRGGGRPGLVYVIPSFQNPAGVTTSLEKRRRLVALAAEHGFLLVEDDPYGELRFEGEAPPTMLSLDAGEHVLYSTSFTKTVAPGVRVGALIIPSSLRGRLLKLANDTYIGPVQLSQATVAEYCKAGRFEANLPAIRDALRERRDALVAAVDRHLGGHAEYVRPEGGYFLWLRLPGVDTDALAARAQDAGVPVVKGSSCYPAGSGQGTDELRLAYSAVRPEDMDPGIERLAALL